MNSKIAKIIGWIISGGLGALFLFSAFNKFAGPEEYKAMITKADDMGIKVIMDMILTNRDLNDVKLANNFAIYV